MTGHTWQASRKFHSNMLSTLLYLLSTPKGPLCNKVFSSQNRSLAHVYVKLDGLGLFIDAPYVAAPLHGLDAPF